MHKNNIFSHISPSFIGAGAPCPTPIGQWKPKARKKERIWRLKTIFQVILHWKIVLNANLDDASL